MVVRMLSAAALAELMRSERPEPITDWLLFGPEDPAAVETRPPAPPMLLAAE